jgi:saccharopine dehydrogenase-like NADP-dependent oxidoreductase
MRVGALPQFPTNEMKYNLTWSTDGLINEYGNPCEAIYAGKLIETLPLEGLEHFSLDGIDYEAFNTSGGVGTLCETLAGKVRNLNYKTIRYRGHRDLMAFLMNELRLNDRRALLKDVLENSVPVTPQDVVLIFCTVTGWKDGRLIQMTDARKIYHGEVLGELWSAIQITTSAGLCAVVDMHATGVLPKQGFVRQEQVKLDEFLANRFGKCYAREPENDSVRTDLPQRSRVM